MLFKESTKLYEYEIKREGGENVMYVNYLGAPFIPSIADYAEIMARTIDTLIESPHISRIIFVQQRNYSYEFSQVQMLNEIAQLYTRLVKQENLLSPKKLVLYGIKTRESFNFISYILSLLKQDPILAYTEVVKEFNNKKDIAEKGYALTLKKIIELLEKTALIKTAKQYLDSYYPGSREIYGILFRPDIIPNFTFTRLVSALPKNVNIIDEYEIASGHDKSNVTILKKEYDTKFIYHINPPEYSLEEEKQILLNLARNVLIEHRPKAEEFTDVERTRQIFLNISRDLISELASSKNINLSYKAINELAAILVRHTIGFGIIEILLQDPNIQDIVINAPITQNKIFVRHAKYDECVTNISPSQEDAESWAAKFRLISGRPLDNANPILDTQLIVGNSRARVSIIQDPLSPYGLAYALRRHRDDPWTLPLFIEKKALNPFASGLLSFLIDGARTFMIAGTRSSGKCVDGNTLIQLSDGNITKIKDLVGREKMKIDDGIIYGPIYSTDVSSLKNMHLSNQKIINVWKRDSPDKVIKIKTKSGKQIITTKEHPYFIYTDALKNKRADELEIGDLIATPRKLCILGNDISINLKNNPYYIGETEDYFILKGKTNSSIVRFPKKVSPEIAELIGLIIGDGHLNIGKLEFYNNCMELREKYISLLKMFGVKYKVFKSRTTTVVAVYSRILNKILNEIFEIPFGKKSDKVVIPKVILKSSNEVLASFLRGYFDTDGYIPDGKRDLELATASKLMSEYLQLALLRFGIVVFTKPKLVNGTYYYRNLIRGNFVREFAQKIGFTHPFKSSRLQSTMALDYIETTNVDVVPEGNKIVKWLRNALIISPKEFRDSGKDYWAYENDEYRVSRKWFGKIVQFYRKKYDYLTSMGDQIELLRNFINFDTNYYLDKLEQVRKLLGVSYLSLVADLEISDGAFRRTLRKSWNGSLETLQRFHSFIDKLKNQLDKLSSLKNVGASVENIPLFVDVGIVSYSEISRDTGIPETTLKYNSLGISQVSVENMSLIENKLRSVKRRLLSNIEESSLLLKKLCSYDFITKCVNVGILLSNFRNILNISNAEFASNRISINTVTNFFTGRHANPSFSVLRSIIETVVKIYDSTISQEVKTFLLKAESLANSDIFWDEIVSIELLDKVDDYVYDLTVESTHNFVANGFIAHNTSLLGSLMLEIMPKYRIIVVEDTLELAVDYMRKLGYDILRMKVRSALLESKTEVSAQEGIRTSLRLGDSALIVGEVRSEEARALYEAMRVGALANTVAGTIHGSSPYSVFDRVVNDLSVPITSFKATDLILITNPIKSPDGLHSYRRVVQLAEVRKHWTRDPLEEKGFVDLLRYNVEKDQLEPTDDLINGDSEVIKDIAANVKGWAGNWDAVYDNIMLRAQLKEEIYNTAKKLKNPAILEADFNAQANNAFYTFSDKIRKEIGLPSSDRVFPLWKNWLKTAVKGL